MLLRPVVLAFEGVEHEGEEHEGVEHKGVEHEGALGGLYIEQKTVSLGLF
jgi:hypothetical protein